MNQIFGINTDIGQQTDAPNLEVQEGTKVIVRNLQSSTGRVYGMAAWFDSDIVFHKNTKLMINNLYSGITVDQNKYEVASKSNRRAEICSFYHYQGGLFPHTEGPPRGSIKVVDNESFDIQQYCIRGNVGCFGDTSMAKLTSFGDIDTEQDDQCILDQDKSLFVTNGMMNISHTLKGNHFVFYIGAVLLFFIYKVCKYMFCNADKGNKLKDAEKDAEYGTF